MTIPANTREAIRKAILLCQWIAESPHQRGSINGQAAQVQYALEQALSADSTSHAGEASTVPPGWKLVPIDPTPEMIGAMAITTATMRLKDKPALGMGGAEEAYAAMLNAAPAAAIARSQHE